VIGDKLPHIGIVTHLKSNKAIQWLFTT